MSKILRNTFKQGSWRSLLKFIKHWWKAEKETNGKKSCVHVFEKLMLFKSPYYGLPGGLMGKNLSWNARDLDRSLIWEDAIATEPALQSPQATTTEPTHCSYWNMPRACAPQQ